MSTHRTPEGVCEHHAEALADGEIWGIVTDYSDDAIFISPDGILRGKHGVRQAFAKLLGDVPKAQWEFKTVFADDTLLLEWSAESAHARVHDGVSTFVFHEGLIRVQTVRYTLQRKD